MALRTSLTWIKRRFAKAIRQLAERELWSRNRYEFTGTFDENSGRFYLVFGTNYPTDEIDFYSKIKTALRAAFPDDPWVITNIGLVIEHVEDLEQVYRNLRVSEDDTDLGDLLA